MLRILVCAYLYQWGRIVNNLSFIGLYVRGDDENKLTAEKLVYKHQAPWCLLFMYKNWDAKSNKTIDFYAKFILKYFSAVSLFQINL